MLRPFFHASVCALLITPAPDGLQLGVAEGETIRRSISLTVERQLDNISQLVNGEDRSGDGSDRSQSSTNALEIVVVDQIQAAVDGKPTKVLRRYEAIGAEVSQESSFRGESNSTEVSLVSELEGEEVLFTFEEDEWTPTLVDGSSLDEAYLVELAASMDLEVILPDGDATEGDEWEAPVDLLDSLTRPGGELGLHSEEEENYEIAETRPVTQRSGTITVTHAGTSEEDENLIVLDLAFDTASTTDLADVMREQFDSLPDSSGMAPEVDSALRSTEAEGSGQALWNSKAGRLESFTFEIEISEVMDQVFRVHTPDSGEFIIESTQESSGTASGEIIQGAG